MMSTFPSTKKHNTNLLALDQWVTEIQKQPGHLATTNHLQIYNLFSKIHPTFIDSYNCLVPWPHRNQTTRLEHHGTEGDDIAPCGICLEIQVRRGQHLIGILIVNVRPGWVHIQVPK